MTTAMQPAPSKAIDWTRPTDKNGLERMGNVIREQMEKALPRFLQGQAPKLIRALIMQAQKTPKLMECTPISLFGATIEAARLGLEIGGPLGHAFLIPFGKDATLIIGYKGLSDLAWRSEKIVGIETGVVRQKDAFDYERGSNSFLRHKEARGDRGNVDCYYVVVKTKTGSTFDLMTIEDAVAFRDRYATVRNAPAFVRDKSPWYEIEEKDGVWIPFNGFNAMVHKTILRKLCKFLPLSPELQMAVKIDEDSERGELQPTQESIPLLLTGGDGEEEQPTAADDKPTSNKLRERMKNQQSETTN